MKLSYSKNHFLLKIENEEDKKTIPSSWFKIDEEIYANPHLKAATPFKRLADRKARRVLERSLFRLYPDALRRPLPPYLDPHQKAGVEFVLTRSRSYLAHAPGAGKTCQAITASLYAAGDEQNVFVVPPYLTVNWERELEKWFAFNRMWFLIRSPTVTIISTEAEESFNTHWSAQNIIVPDSMLTRPWVIKNLERIKKKLVAVDEASRFKECTAQRTKALFGGDFYVSGKRTHSVGFIKDARHAVLMDGSPMPNRPMELWAPVYALSPETINFMSQDDFGRRYCGATVNAYGCWEYKHSSNEKELRRKLRDHFMHVVPENALNHPERLRKIIYMTKDPRAPWMREWEKKNLVGNFEFSEDASKGELATVRRELGERKVEWVSEYIRERLKSGAEHILLFAWHRNVCERLYEIFREQASIPIMGKTSDNDREAAFKSFQRGKTRLLVGNISSMGRGHNLQSATRVVFAEFSWTDELNRQCEKRASRKGSKQRVIPCDYIVAPDSLDERVASALFRKKKTVDKIIGI